LLYDIPYWSLLTRQLLRRKSVSYGLRYGGYDVLSSRSSQPCGWGSDFIGVDSTKIRENEGKLSFKALIFVFLENRYGLRHWMTILKVHRRSYETFLYLRHRATYYTKNRKGGKVQYFLAFFLWDIKRI
jgi:hypothetical protein